MKRTRLGQMARPELWRMEHMAPTAARLAAITPIRLATEMRREGVTTLSRG
jgi:hypothetical protein